LPDRTIAGLVAIFAPASGSVFSLLPPDNATGNFPPLGAPEQEIVAENQDGRRGRPLSSDNCRTTSLL
jgi:hypothetical protein